VNADEIRGPNTADQPCGWTIGDFIRLLAVKARETEQAQAEAYAAGHAAGYEAGHAAAESEMDEHWAQLSRRIRTDAERLVGTVTTPIERPQPDDSIWFADTPRRIGRAA
jgi:hypothetical protein